MGENLGSIRIELSDMSLAQLVFMHAVVIPEIKAVIDSYANDLKELM